MSAGSWRSLTPGLTSQNGKPVAKSCTPLGRHSGRRPGSPGQPRPDGGQRNAPALRAPTRPRDGSARTFLHKPRRHAAHAVRRSAPSTTYCRIGANGTFPPTSTQILLGFYALRWGERRAQRGGYRVRATMELNGEGRDASFALCRCHMPQPGSGCGPLLCPATLSSDVPMPRACRWDREQLDWSARAGLGQATMLRCTETRGSGRLWAVFVRTYATRALDSTERSRSPRAA